MSTDITVRDLMHIHNPPAREMQPYADFDPSESLHGFQIVDAIKRELRPMLADYGVVGRVIAQVGPTLHESDRRELIEMLKTIGRRERALRKLIESK